MLSVGKRALGIACAMTAAIAVSGCKSLSVIGKADLAIDQNELQYFRDLPHSQPSCLLDDICRNDYITMKMFLIDQNFADYKILLSRGEGYGQLGVDIAQIGLAAAGGVIPVSQTTKVLSAASAAVGLTNTAFNKDLLLAQSIQVIEDQMETGRASVKKTILSRLQCNAEQYPAGLVLSDLQSYADAGTITGALNAIAKNIANAQPTTNASKGTATPTTTSTTPGSEGPFGAGLLKDLENVSDVRIHPTTITVIYKRPGKPSNCPIDAEPKTPKTPKTPK
jgi:hypothetical protein